MLRRHGLNYSCIFRKFKIINLLAMKKFISILSFLCFGLTVSAQNTSEFGIGIGYTWAWSYWYVVEANWNGSFYDYDYYYPTHNHHFMNIEARYETKPILNLGPIQGELAFSLQFGLGNTRAYWLTNEEKLSNLGLILGITPEVKFLYPLNNFSPFLGLSFQGAAIYSDGGRVSETDYAINQGYEEFGEYFYGGGLNIGTEISLESIKVMPFYRVTWLGGSSDWYRVDSEQATHTIESLGLAFMF